MGSPVRTYGGVEAKEPEFIDGERARAARTAMPSDRMVRALAETFGTLSDPTRVRIISALAGEELCVFDLARLLGLSGSAISHQLRLLRGQRLVKYRKEGKIAFFSPDDDHIGTSWRSASSTSPWSDFFYSMNEMCAHPYEITRMLSNAKGGWEGTCASH